MPTSASTYNPPRPQLRRSFLGGWLIVWLFSLFTIPVLAQTECVDDCVEVGSWRVNVGMGVGMRSNPLHGGDDIPLVLLPEVSYFGERFFLENLEMGFTLFENDRHQFNALITPGYDQMYFNRWDPFNFSDAGGFTSGGPGGVGGPIASNTYQVNISGSISTSSGGAAPSDPNLAPSGVYVQSAQAVIINGRQIDLSNGTQYLLGSENNPIAVDVTGDSVHIMGVVEGDRIELGGVNVKGPADVGGRGGAEVNFTGTDGDADTLLIDPAEGGVYRVTANANAMPSSNVKKIAAEQVAHRKMAGLAGLEYSYTLAHASLHLQAFTDFTGVHDGRELRAAVIFPWQLGEQKWALTLGGNYKSRKVLNYYYGVSERDTDISDLHFSPAEAGFERMLRVDWQLPLTEHWSLRAMMQYSELPNSVENSPLVSERGVGSAFFGGIYHF